MRTFVLFCAFICAASASTLTIPPLTALVVGFEKVYDLSLLANTLSDNGIDVFLIIPGKAGPIYENLIAVEVIKLNYSTDANAKREERALKGCEALLSNLKVLKRVQEIQPTFTIFPALRHDACLLPWVSSIDSIPVIWSEGHDDEFYAVTKSRMGIPVHRSGFFDRFKENILFRAIVSQAENSYVSPALQLAKDHLPNIAVRSLDDLYDDVQLLLWGVDSVLRRDFASLTERIVEVGCHHCRGAQPLPAALQKELIEFKKGTVAVTLDSEYSNLIEQLASQLPQGRDGQAVVWKSKFKFGAQKPSNLFVHSSVDRQDIVGYGRTRVLLSHCADTELLEAAFHGTPVLCFARNPLEMKNAQRAIELNLSLLVADEHSVESVLKAVEEVHETARLREAARSVSRAIRERPLPASDRMVFWLRFLARNAEDYVKLSHVDKSVTVATYAEDMGLFFGLLVGAAFGALFVATTGFSWYLQNKGSKQFRKLKAKKYNR